MEKDKVIVW